MESQNTETAEELMQEFPLLGNLVEGEAPPEPASGPEEPKTVRAAEQAVPDPVPQLQKDLEDARQRVQQLERERWLLSQGVPEDDLDYIAFKADALVTPEKDFAAAAKEYLKKHRGLHAGGISTGIGLGGQLGSRPPGINETMNRLIRGE